MVGAERGEKAIDECPMGPGVVGFAPLLEVGLLERIGLAGAIRGVLELAPGVIHLSQAELKRPASSSGQAGFGQPSLDRRPVSVRKFVPEAGCQPGQRTVVPGIMPQSLTEFSLGSVKVAELLEQAPQRGVGANQVGLLLNGLAEARLGLVEPTQLLENVTENGQREWEIGAQSDSLPAMRQGLRRLVQFEQHLAQVALGLGRDRVELHGLAKMLDRRNPVSQKPQRVGQVVVGGGEAGPEPDRFAEMGDRLVHGPQVDQCCPEITVAFGMTGLKLQGGPIGVDGAIKLPERPERCGEGGVISRLGGADRDRPAHKRGRPTGISPLERDQPQEMESIGMIGRLSQGRLVQARGLLEPALPVVLDRCPQIDRHGPGSSGRVIASRHLATLVDNVGRFARGETLLNIVDKPLWY